MLKKVMYLSLSVIVSFSLVTNCSKEKKEPAEEKEYQVSMGVEGQKFSVESNYDSLLTEVNKLSEQISANPTDLSLKTRLVDVCYDSTINMIIAAGRGQPLSDAPTHAVAMNYAERAATIEALRWAANIKQWSHDPAKSLSQELDLTMPMGRVVSKTTLPDSTIQVLIVVNAEKLP